MHPLTINVQPHDIFNLPLFSYFFVIDTRQKGAYEANHIASAFNFCPTPSNPDGNVTTKEYEVELGKLICMMVEESMAPMHITPVVLIGDDVCELSKAGASWLSHRLAELQKLKSTISVANQTPNTSSNSKDENPNDWRQKEVDRVMLQLSALDTEVWWVNGGFPAFYAQFPSQCSRGDWANAVPTLDTIGPTPRLITPSVFLGARDLDMKELMVQTYSVTHIICATDTSCPRSLIDEPVETISGTTYLRCTVGDDCDEDMTACFMATTAFILDAVAKGGRVMVFLHGRTRSASIIAAYLMCTHNWTAQHAFDQISSICKMKYHLASTSFDPMLQQKLMTQLNQIATVAPIQN